MLDSSLQFLPKFISIFSIKANLIDEMLFYAKQIRKLQSFVADRVVRLSNRVRKCNFALTK